MTYTGKQLCSFEQCATHVACILPTAMRLLARIEFGEFEDAALLL